MQPRYGPVIVPSGPIGPISQPTEDRLNLSRAEIPISRNLENVPYWQLIFQGVDMFWQNILLFFKPNCSVELLRYVAKMLLFTVGVATIRTAVEIDKQPESCTFMLRHCIVMMALTLSSLAFRFIGGDSLFKRILGTLEKPPQALIDEVSSGLNIYQS